jgi:hypothetical protein
MPPLANFNGVVGSARLPQVRTQSQTWWLSLTFAAAAPSPVSSPSRRPSQAESVSPACSSGRRVPTCADAIVSLWVILAAACEHTVNGSATTVRWAKFPHIMNPLTHARSQQAISTISTGKCSEPVLLSIAQSISWRTWSGFRSRHCDAYVARLSSLWRGRERSHTRKVASSARPVCWSAEFLRARRDGQRTRYGSSTPHGTPPTNPGWLIHLVECSKHCG